MTKPQNETSKNDNNEDWTLQRDALKVSGDAAFRKQDYKTAILEYTHALSLDPNNGRLLSNRSAAYLKNNETSKALHDAVACVETDTMGNKGISRHAAALQALGRYPAALEQWQAILQTDPQHLAALAGVKVCQTKVDKLQPAKQEDEHDDLDDFFEEVDAAEDEVARAKREAAESDKIKQQKKDLGTPESQVQRLLRPSYEWYNLNPFSVLDLPHTSTQEDISRRFKALSLLLHPDKNPNLTNAQRAYDQVLKAKEILYDTEQADHIRNLIAQSLQQAHDEYETTDKTLTLKEYQNKMVHLKFAERERRRRQAETNAQSFVQRTQQQQDETEQKEISERKFDKSFKKSDRQEKRVGNWRDFQHAKKKKS